MNALVSDMVPVFLVSDDGMADKSQVRADLMGAARMQCDLEERHLAARFEDLVFGRDGERAGCAPNTSAW